jgi:hypothetical protein
MMIIISQKMIIITVLLLDLGRFFIFLIPYTVGMTLGRGISSSHGRYLHTQQQKSRIKAQTSMP